MENRTTFIFNENKYVVSFEKLSGCGKVDIMRAIEYTNVLIEAGIDKNHALMQKLVDYHITTK